MAEAANHTSPLWDDLDKEGAEPPKPKTLTEKDIKDFKAMLRMPMPADIVNFKSKGAK